MGKRKKETEAGRKAAGQIRARSGEHKPDGNTEEKKVRSIQMLLWVCVILVQMAVVGNMEVHAMERHVMEVYVMELEETRYLTIRSGTWEQKEDCREPEKYYRAEDGREYRMISWEREQTLIPERKRLVKKQGVCRQVEGNLQVPESITMTVWEGTRRTDAICCLTEKEMVREEWQDGFSFPVTFHKYDARMYQLGDHMISDKEELPRLKGYEELLLEEIGVRPEEYRILDIRWEGEPYEDETGELCRDAAAFGQKLVRDYRLVYEGEAVFPAYTAWRTAALYEAEEGPDDGDKETEEIQKAEEDSSSEGTEEEDRNKTSDELTLWEKITRTLLLTIAVGAALFFGGLLLLAVLWIRKAVLPYGKGHKEHNEKKH